MREWQNLLSKEFIVAGKEMYRWIRYVLRRLFRCFLPATPRITNIELNKETSMGLVYRIFLPSITDSDVVKRVLEYTYDSSVKTIDIGVVERFIDLPPVKDNTNISVRLKHVDDADNEGDWCAPLAFTAKDTIVPSAPSGLSTKLVAEAPDVVEPEPDPAPPPPAPEPEPDTKVVEEPEVEVTEPTTLYSYKKSK